MNDGILNIRGPDINVGGLLFTFRFAAGFAGVWPMYLSAVGFGHSLKSAAVNRATHLARPSLITGAGKKGVLSGKPIPSQVSHPWSNFLGFSI